MKFNVFLLFIVSGVLKCAGTLSCTDNLSCPRSDPDSETLQCISTSQLCDGTNLCSGGQDEGGNLSTLDCEYKLNIISFVTSTLCTVCAVVYIVATASESYIAAA